MSRLLQKLNAEFYTERERERVEDLNIFLGFLFMGIHSSELKMLIHDRYDILGNKHMVCEIHYDPNRTNIFKKKSDGT